MTDIDVFVDHDSFYLLKHDIMCGIDFFVTIDRTEHHRSKWFWLSFYEMILET